MFSNPYLDCVHLMFPPEQVYSYDCKFAGVVEGRATLSGYISIKWNLLHWPFMRDFIIYNLFNFSETIISVGLESFGSRVLEFLKNRVSFQFPPISPAPLSNYEIQHSEHETFLVQRSQVLRFFRVFHLHSLEFFSQFFRN